MCVAILIWLYYKIIVVALHFCTACNFTLYHTTQCTQKESLAYANLLHNYFISKNPPRFSFAAVAGWAYIILRCYPYKSY